MAEDNIANLTLERVHRLEDGQRDLVGHVVEVKTGLTLLKKEMATMHSEFAQVHNEMAHIHAQLAHQSERLDGMEILLQRIAARLDLIEA